MILFQLCLAIIALSESLQYLAQDSFDLIVRSRFIWIARGFSLSRRLRHLEERWAYYFAFGSYG